MLVHVVILTKDKAMSGVSTRLSEKYIKIGDIKFEIRPAFVLIVVRTIDAVLDDIVGVTFYTALQTET